jgi:hypothetical protein
VVERGAVAADSADVEELAAFEWRVFGGDAVDEFCDDGAGGGWGEGASVCCRRGGVFDAIDAGGWELAD